MDEALPSLLPGNISLTKKLSSPGNSVRVKAVSGCRRLCYGIVVVCLLINTLVLVKMSLFGELADIRAGRDPQEDAGNVRRLAVVVPAHGGDLSKALASLSRWPKVCSAVTLRHVELVLYYAGGPEDERWSDDVIPALEQTGGRCFARTSALFGNLTDEENVYPKGPSVQFYKLFLDETIRSQMSSFGAIAIIEWDVLVAHDRSFERLHHAAFDAVEPFWVKGSTLAGTNFHGTAAITDHWHVLGHINGNAIYNNSDPAFVEFIDFTLARWEYTYSYDVAIWATIADFPYSWPLWQRFSSKFVTTNLIANVGFLDVDPNTVGKALASETMFIHGSLTGGGGTQFAASDRSTAVAAAQAAQAARLDEVTPIPEEQSSVTRTMEASSEGRGADGGGGGGDFSPSTAGCKTECGSGVFDAGDGDAGGDAGGLFLSTVCDHSCGSEESGGWRFGGRSCGAGDEDRYGSHCRLCYVDADEALKAERLLESQQRQAGHDGGQHVVMCDTMRPPESPNCSLKCATKLDTICDHRCGSGHLNDYNCNWRDRGAHCRFCFDDLDAALVADQAAKRNGGRVIMCNTHEPPVEKTQPELDPLELKRVEDSAAAAEVDAEDDDRSSSHQGDLTDTDDDNGSSSGEAVTTASPPAATLPYGKDLVRGDLCAFMTGYFIFLAETEASVRSLAHFMPGMRVRVAVDPIYFSVFNRTVGAYPEVEVVNATTAGGHASLLADVFCGDGTKLIYYLGPGEVISRTFTKKDTHGTRGDLLVPFTEPERLDDFHLKRTQATTSVLGFRSPSFSYGTDLFLPAWINRRLRHLLVAGADGSSRAWERTKEEEQQLAVSLVLETEDAHVPELLAGLAYSQNPPGIWFLNPQQWVTHHMFQQASVWDIPLVKPRFGCSTNLALAAEGYDVAHELNRFADSVGSGVGVGSGGSKCETGFLQLDPSQLRPKPDVEFGAPATGNRPMPRVESMRVSVLYDATTAEVDEADQGNGGAWVLNATLPTVIDKFPGALEVVVAVGNEGAKRAYEEVVGRYRSHAPYELRVVLVGDGGVTAAVAARNQAVGGGAADERWGVTSTSSSVVPLGGGGGGGKSARLRYPLLWADEVCRGRFVLHLDVDSVLLETVTYDHVFHFGKPVIPFTRFSDAEISEEQHPGNACWRSKASQVLGVRQDEPVVHDFSAYDTHVYPIGLYPALRAHVRATEAITRDSEGSLADVMSAGACEGGGSGEGAVVVGGAKEEVGRRRWFRREMQYNLMASFMWFRMRGSIHWRAIDALDLQPDEWLTDPDKYRSWSCNLVGPHAEQAAPPTTTNASAAFRQQVSELDSVEACGGFAVP
ncbi:unnamed protein product [Scytosiphon promiscuus]